MKYNHHFLVTACCTLLLLLIACKREDPYAVSDSIYGTYVKSNVSTSDPWSSFGGVIIKVAPVNSTYIRISFSGVLSPVTSVYDSVRLYADRTFTVDQIRYGVHISGNGNFGYKTISLLFRDDSSMIIERLDNVSKLNDHY